GSRPGPALLAGSGPPTVCHCGGSARRRRFPRAVLLRIIPAAGGGSYRPSQNSPHRRPGLPVNGPGGPVPQGSGPASLVPTDGWLAEEMRKVAQIRIHRPRVRREPPCHEVLPPDPRDPDVVRAKALARANDRAGRRTARPPRYPRPAGTPGGRRLTREAL